MSLNLFPLAALNPIAGTFFGIPIHWYGIIIATGVVIALLMAVREGKKLGIDEDTFYDFLLWALPISLICARAYYVIFQWSYYRVHPNEIIAIWDGGIAIYGGLLGGLLVLWLFSHKRGLSALTMLDVIVPGVILAQAMGRWGNFFNQEAFGRITTRATLVSQHIPNFIINQMYIGGHYRIPTFLYESTWDFVGFLILILLRHRQHLFKRGEIFFTYVAWYAFGRFFIEGMRTDSLMLGNIRVSQLLSVILFVLAIGAFIYRRRHRPNLPWYLDGVK